jgi:putative SOS response-associated peptidase YedK
MCGRFTLRAPAHVLAEAFGVSEVSVISPRFNIAPTQNVLALRLNDQHHREMALLKWGLIPSWSADPKIGNQMINARAGTVAEKPSFRSAFKKRRCLVVADGFYEWKKDGQHKQPYFIHLKSDQPFAFAGLWEYWKKADTPIESCTIITTDANALMADLHDRMPVILPKDAAEVWLDESVEDAEALKSLLVPYPDDDLEAYPVSTVVNSPKNDVAECVERVDE